MFKISLKAKFFPEKTPFISPFQYKKHIFFIFFFKDNHNVLPVIRVAFEFAKLIGLRRDTFHTD